ncbi:MAG: hypothetical protein DWP95_00890 [Proteobacteria bacterium]|nr:MAG: hypothetical protein DWP95_00890 [Pseudomonadota bacterium]
MTPVNFKPLLAATVMSAIYMAGAPTTAQAVAETYDVNTSQTQLVERQGGAVDYVIPEPTRDGLRRYIIQMDKPSTVMSGFGPGGVALRSPAAEQYLDELVNDQVNLLSTLQSILGRQVETINSFQHSYNGVAVYLADHEVAQVESQANVKRVLLDKDYLINTDVGPFLIGADELWQGHGAANPDVIFMDGFDGAMPQGSGVVVGIIDTGINFSHPSFAAMDENGYTHTNPLGDGNYRGVCDPTSDQYTTYNPSGTDYTCNAKLIGGYDFVHGLEGSGFDNPGPEDENGHGSHTASTSAGNTLHSVSYLGVSDITISGVAPKANVVMFDACYNDTLGRGLCPGVSSVASVEQAIEDGDVNVLNFSIGGGTSPWTDPVSMAFLSATQAGIFVSASAGNSGPGPGTLGHNEPWTASVAATTHGRSFTATLTVDVVDYDYIAGDGPTVPAPAVSNMRFAGDVDPGNNEGCAAWPLGTEFTGEIALIDRGSCAFADKVNNAEAAGAVAVIVANNTAGALRMGGLELTNIPAGSILQSDGTAIKAALAGGVLSATMYPPIRNTSGQADVLADFSSRGPSPFEYNKPDVAAPGVDILAAYTNSGGTEPDYAAISGTSMAAPHNAGAAALLIERNPSWSVAEVKSALMMKAVTAGVMKEDGVTPADPFDMGAGRIQVDNAATATLVLDESASNFAAADPGNGGDLKTLNVASLTDYNCQGTCTFTRTFRSVADSAIDYQATLNGVPGTVTPSTFTVPKNGFQTLTIEVDASALPFGTASFGELEITDVPAASIPFSQAVGIEIPDGDYPNSAACGQVTVSGITFPLTGPMSVDLDISHTWIGDLVITLENPNADVLGLMSRPGVDEIANPGGFGSSDDFVGGATVRFIDSATTSAEDSTGCASGVCELAPAPDSLPQPPSTLADVTTTDVNGTWEVCVGDAGAFITGPFNSMTLNMPAPAAAPQLHTLPVTVVAVQPSPVINVIPGSLSYNMATNSSSSQNAYIQNESSATGPLDWSVQASGSINVQQFEQVNTGTGDGIVSDYYDQGGNFGAYSADNFVLNNGAQLDVFYFDGFTNGLDLNTEIDAFTVEVYADNAGVPAGDPETPASALFQLTLAVGDPNLTLTAGGEVTVDVLGALGSSWSVPAGNYWVSGWANFVGGDRWNWYAGIPNTANNSEHAQIIDPTDAFGGGFTSWTDLTVIDPVFAGLAFSVSSNYTCGAPWLSTSPGSGSGIAIGGSDTVSVTVDTTGLAPGNYSAALCINSNDTSQPNTVVPVSLTVN